MTPDISVMSGSPGDIFWDLPPWMTYTPGFDLGCNIYVANSTATPKEYALIARLSRETTVISEESVPVFGFAWFTVDPGDFITLKGALRFTDSDADLTVTLVERESGEVTDSVATRLVAPATSALPPSWPGAPGGTGGTINWSSLMTSMVPILGLVMFGMVMVSAFKPKEEKKVLVTGRND